MKSRVLAVSTLCVVALTGLIGVVIQNACPTDSITSVELVKPVMVVTEVAPFPFGERPAFVEFQNRSGGTLDISGYVVVTGIGSEFPIGSGQAPIPKDGLLLLSLGDKQYQPGEIDESTTIIYGPEALANPWQPSMGQLVLRSPAGKPVTCVVWGTPLDQKHLIPGIEKLWRPGWFVHLHDSFGLYELGTAITPGASIGLYPDSPTTAPADWTVHDVSAVTPGAINLVPQPSTYTTPDGATVDGTHFAIAWKGRRHDKRYEYQLASKIDFAPSSIIEQGFVDVPLYERNTRLPAGAYFFRVRAEPKIFRGEPGSNAMRRFAPELKFFTANLDGSNEVTLNMQHFIQRKDSSLLCLDGCLPETDTSTVKHWNKPHLKKDDHGAQYCVRASVAMMVSNYDEKMLSQDRIALFTEEELCRILPPRHPHCKDLKNLKAPEGDLAHGRPIFCNEPNSNSPDCPPITETLKWALNEQVEFFKGDSTAFSEVQGWIDAGRPILARLKLHHVVAINGYSSSRIEGYVLINDPLKDSPGRLTFDAAHYKGFWVGPPTADNALSDGEGWNLDSDEDGVTDFDEERRFATNYLSADTDNDGVDDLNDIREYVFSPDGVWDLGTKYTVLFESGAEISFKRVADSDGDGLRKEIDRDNDNDGCLDGDEDSNGNGVFELDIDKSHNFVNDCKPCPILLPGCRFWQSGSDDEIRPPSVS